MLHGWTKNGACIKKSLKYFDMKYFFCTALYLISLQTFSATIDMLDYMQQKPIGLL